MLVYLVDDDDVFNTLHEATIKRLLEDAEIKIYKSGEEVYHAINQIKEFDQVPDLMFLDIRMPDMDGFELLDSLERMADNPFRRTAIYMLSSTLDERDLMKAENSSLVKGFISKPLESEQLRQLLNTIK
jgi:CheY-like chemotaxis protein